MKKMTHMDTTLFSLEERGDVAVVRFKPRESLYTADSRAMIDAWAAMDEIQIQDKRVVIFRTPKDYLSPKIVDDFWRRAKEAPLGHASRGEPPRPHMVAAADISIKRSLTFLKSLPALTIVVCDGEVDFDLLGLLLACKYRICSPDTMFVNRTLRRKVGPGSATPWFLARSLGIAKTRKLYLDEVALTANEALELGVVDRLCDAESLEQDALSVAEHLAQFDQEALSSLMKAMQLLDLDLATYLEQAGTGFERIARSD